MGPNEAQLRAALHDGEGELLDAGRLIAHGHRARETRRRRITSIATSAAVVAVVGVGVTAMITVGHDSENAGSGGGQSIPGAAAGANPGTAHGGTGLTAAPRGPAASATKSANAYAADGKARATTTAAGLTCPNSATRYLLPGGGGLGEFGSDEPLFARAVSAMKVCVYQGGVGRVRTSAVISGQPAADLAAKLEAAPAKPDRQCAGTTTLLGQTELLAVDSRGRAMKPVVITVSCVSQVTNGTAVRYVDGLPDRIARLINRPPMISVPPMPQRSASPVR